MLGDGAIGWFSRAQRVTASASSESEYMAFAEIVKETISYFVRCKNSSCLL